MPPPSWRLPLTYLPFLVGSVFTLLVVSTPTLSLAESAPSSLVCSAPPPLSSPASSSLARLLLLVDSALSPPSSASSSLPFAFSSLDNLLLSPSSLAHLLLLAFLTFLPPPPLSPTSPAPPSPTSSSSSSARSSLARLLFLTLCPSSIALLLLVTLLPPLSSSLSAPLPPLSPPPLPGRLRPLLHLHRPPPPPHLLPSSPSLAFFFSPPLPLSSFWSALPLLIRSLLPSRLLPLLHRPHLPPSCWLRPSSLVSLFLLLVFIPSFLARLFLAGSTPSSLARRLPLTD